MIMLARYTCKLKIPNFVPTRSLYHVYFTCYNLVSCGYAANSSKLYGIGVCGPLICVKIQREFEVPLQQDFIAIVWLFLGRPMAYLSRGSLSEAGWPKFSFGIITDVQYADIPDGHSFLGVPRYYRHSLEVLKRAVISWNNHGGHSFVMNLGDIVDGRCPKESSHNSVVRVVNEFNAFFLGPVYHILGNHCLYNLPRNELNEILKIPTSDGCSYYDFCPFTGFRVVVLDGYDISAIGWPKGHPHRIQAVNLLEKKNPNVDKNSPIGLTGDERRFVKFNGGIGKEQLAWLDETLLDATSCRQKVIICSHLSLHPDATDTSSLLWNYGEVLHVIHRYKCVKVCLAGHTHVGGYALDSHGVHHRVLEAALECPPGTDAFGYVDVYENRLSLVGTGCMESTEICID